MTFFIIALFTLVPAYIATRSWRIAFGLAIMVTAYAYVNMPILNWGFFGLPAILTCTGAVCFAYARKHGRMSYIAALTLSAGLVFLTVLPFISSWSGFYEDDYHKLIGDIASAKTRPPVQLANLSTDALRAREQARRVLNRQSELSQSFAIGELRLQAVNGAPAWLAPLIYRDFRAWRQNRAGAPAYVVVDNNETMSARLVREVNGKPVRIKYQAEAWFADNLRRHVYLRGYHEKGLTNFTFQLDDRSRPYYVATLYENKVGYFGADATGILVIDPGSGHIQEFTLKSAPDWAQFIHPEVFIHQQLQAWANIEGLALTQTPSCVYDSSGRCYLSVQLNPGINNGIASLLIDPLTKAAHYPLFNAD